MKIPDPLEELLKKIPFNKNLIYSITTGKKYSAVVLQDGKTGVCATLGHTMQLPSDLKYIPENLDNLSHRNILIAYFNAIINKPLVSGISSDIFEIIDFSRFKNQLIVMTGYFAPLVARFNKNRIPIKVFDMKGISGDYSKTDHYESLQNCSIHILTSTAVFNRSFQEIMSFTHPSCLTYLLGPSTTMHRIYFEIFNIAGLFGTYIPPHNNLVLKLIQEGGGARTFQKFCQKTFLLK